MTNKVIIDCQTNEAITVPLTDEEIADLDKMNADYEARKAKEEMEAQAKAEAKASALAKLTSLGLTEDEAKAIIG